MNSFSFDLQETVPFIADGLQIKSLAELSAALKKMDDATFRKFASNDKNDFYHWIKDCVGDVRLSRDIMMLRKRENVVAAIDRRIADLKDFVRHPENASIEKRIDMYVDHVVFHIDNELCCNCEICSLICPKEAVEIKDGKKTVNDKCTKCGFCVHFCPVSAISLTVNGKESTFYRDKKMVPRFPQPATVNGTKAMKFLTGIHVVKDECPAGCELCISACPITIIRRYDDDIELPRIKTKRRECLFCGACKNACPYHLIEVRRTHVVHEGGDYSNVWNRAIEKLTRPELKNVYHNNKNIEKLKRLFNKSGLRKY